MKLLLVVPVATTTLCGTAAIDPFELASVTVASLDGAGTLSVTVTLGETPPLTLVALNDNAASAADSATGWTVTVVVLVAPP